MADDRLARKNALVLAVAQALAGGNNTVIVATGGIVGTMLAPDKSLATLADQHLRPSACGSARCRSVGWRAAIGRRTAYQIGTVFGVLTGLISFVAVAQGSFLLFLRRHVRQRSLCGGALSYRFAAADTASERFRPKAISWVMIGGIVAGIIGPQVVIFTKD